MKTPTENPNLPPGRKSAFTLIELIVVITIIIVLAALIFPTAATIRHNAIRSKVKSELSSIETAIEAYKSKYHVYPPDNPGNFMTNPLYFELMGTKDVVGIPGQYQTLDSKARITVTDLPTIFGGNNVMGFQNHMRESESGDGQRAESFFAKAGVPPTQIGTYGVGNSTVCLLVSSVQWPAVKPALIKGQPGLNPFRYNSSSPTNNPNSYDLWVDVYVGKKTNRISNWIKKHQVVH